ncbi:unnamed protein product [Arabis nemorensis]|uniref:C3H1-type domain-containing protein n=1 Tax=Arabis nemorensis TaxID=586526 RepID=A0A565BBN4_9BRAS|nr:unnamed protein product [Arabis nemorensis]
MVRVTRTKGSLRNSDLRVRVTGNSNSWGRFGGNRTVTKTEKVCNFWVDGNCTYGDKCRYLHCWSKGDSFSLLTQLDGHEKLVSGIALPSGSDKIYTGSKDETIRVWDCASGQIFIRFFKGPSSNV